ncbi:MAG: ornithine carbamoyltransferase [Firmicutes bacterium]|nr:ornithine carbamoyltransferase [Bacillota bacterium]
MVDLYLDPRFKGRDFISIHDYTADEVQEIFKVARILKEKQKRREPHPVLAGKTLGMIFQKNSTRTRVSFEVGMYQLGGYALFLSSNDLQLKRGETIGDTARTLSRYLDGIMIRTFSHDEVLELAKYADIPVINGLTDLLHPCQVMGDLLTALEKKGRLAGLKLAFIGDGNNVAHSLMFGGAKVGMDVVVASPAGFKPSEEIVRLARADAAASGARIEVVEDPREAAEGADIIYTDVWASMGQEAEREARARAFVNFQVNAELLKVAKPDVIVMHCLPAHRGEEITDEVMDGPHSVVFDEAENRLHIQKAIMALTMS